MKLTFALEILGTIAFAYGGALVAIDLKLDLLGIYIAAVITAVGGGMTRDLLLGNTPPLLFRNPVYVVVAFLTTTAIVVFYKTMKKSKNLKRLETYMVVTDALGLAIFTVVGMDICIQQGFGGNLFLTASVGVITAVGGGLLRDVFVNRLPLILSKEVYATASIAGAILYTLLHYFKTPAAPAALLAIITITAIRLYAVKQHIDLPVIENDRN